MEYQIRLIDVQFTDIDCKIKSFDKEITEDMSTSLAIDFSFDENDNKKFSVIFNIGLNNEKKDFKFNLKAIANFSANIEMTSEFKNSLFIKANAPAIAFPYVRVFISNITLNAGYNPIVLPSFNFMKLAEENKDKP